MLPYASIAGPDGSPYLGFQYALGEFNIDNPSGEFNPTTLVASAGKYFHDNFSFQGRIGFPVKDDTKSISGVETTVGLFNLLGFYGAGHYNLGKTSSVYALAGVSFVEAEIEVSSTTDSGSEIGLSYGVGADIGIGFEKTTLNIEYMAYLNKSGLEINAIGLGLKVVF